MHGGKLIEHLIRLIIIIIPLLLLYVLRELSSFNGCEERTIRIEFFNLQEKT
jgi:hypothetical protein